MLIFSCGYADDMNMIGNKARTASSVLARAKSKLSNLKRCQGTCQWKYGRHLSLICMFKLSYRILNRIIWIKEMVLGGDTIQYHFYRMLIR